MVFVMGFGWDFTPIPSLLSQLKRTALRLLSTWLSLINTLRDNQSVVAIINSGTSKDSTL